MRLQIIKVYINAEQHTRPFHSLNIAGLAYLSKLGLPLVLTQLLLFEFGPSVACNALWIGLSLRVLFDEFIEHLRVSLGIVLYDMDLCAALFGHAPQLIRHAQLITPLLLGEALRKLQPSRTR